MLDLDSFMCGAVAHAVQSAGIQTRARVLDLACGLGGVAITAARMGADVTGVDWRASALSRAQSGAQTAGVRLALVEADAHHLPFADGSFDVVISHFGHMWMLHSLQGMDEMLRVLRSGGRLALTTYPPDSCAGRIITAAHDSSVSVCPTQWGIPGFVTTTLSSSVVDLRFENGQMRMPALSPNHHAQQVRQTYPRAKASQEAIAAIVEEYFDPRTNTVDIAYLVTTATKQ